MIMVGFFEDLPSERAIAARCADSIAIRRFLNYELDENTPDHSSLTIIRQRLGLEIYQQVFKLCLQALQEHGLLRGKQLGIDSSVMEANASLRALVNRNTAEQYWDYVKRLAAEQGIDPEDAAAVRKFDRQRPGKGSNQEWENPHDPDAKIGPKKHGGTDMIYKPETVVDLDTGAVVQAEVQPGDHADHQGMATTILEAQQSLNEARGEATDILTVETVTADKGYYAVEELRALQDEGIRTVIADPVSNRRLDKLEPEQRQAVQAALRSTRSKWQSFAAPARHAHRTELCAYFRLRWDEAGDAAWMGEPQQALQARCGFLQSLSTDAQTLRIWDAEAAGGPGQGCFCSFAALVGLNGCRNSQTRQVRCEWEIPKDFAGTLD